MDPWLPDIPDPGMASVWQYGCVCVCVTKAIWQRTQNECSMDGTEKAGQFLKAMGRPRKSFLTNSAGLKKKTTTRIVQHRSSTIVCTSSRYYQQFALFIYLFTLFCRPDARTQYCPLKLIRAPRGTTKHARTTWSSAPPSRNLFQRTHTHTRRRRTHLVFFIHSL